MNLYYTWRFHQYKLGLGLYLFMHSYLNLKTSCCMVYYIRIHTKGYILVWFGLWYKLTIYYYSTIISNGGKFVL